MGSNIEEPKQDIDIISTETTTIEGCSFFLKVCKNTIPQTIQLNPTMILNQNIQYWKDPILLKEFTEVDFPRSNFVQDGFVVEYPIFPNIPLTLNKQLLWLCTQAIQQEVFIKLHIVISKCNPDFSLKQADHVRETVIVDGSIKRYMCCDIIRHHNFTLDVIQHLCILIDIKWDREMIRSIEFTIL